jgi:hypothetical protein
MSLFDRFQSPTAADDPPQFQCAGCEESFPVTPDWQQSCDLCGLTDVCTTCKVCEKCRAEMEDSQS